MMKFMQRMASGIRHELVSFDEVSSRMNENVWIRGRVHRNRLKGNIGFLVLRKQLSTVQCIFAKGEVLTKQVIKEIGAIPPESVVDVYGKVVKAGQSTACSIAEYEILVEKFEVVSKSLESLPFTYEEGSSYERVNTKTRLDYRFMDLRLEHNQILFKFSSQICQKFREFLEKHNFLEIHSPKIIQGVSEGGSEVFKLDYFGKPACLAQSPQLYKQMAVNSDLERVYEIAPVFRAENSNTHRHLCEFIGLDLEMTLSFSYMEVIQLVHNLLLNVFSMLENMKEMDVIYRTFNVKKIEFHENLQLFTFEEACKMLNENGFAQDSFEDFSLESEKKLGEIIKNLYSTDFYAIHRFPTKVRPFYTKPCPENSLFSCSFDFFLRGEEIASGSQRISDYEELKASALNKGINLESIASYLDSFKYAAFPHAGCGLGLERLLMLYAGLSNIRLASLFPRDPKRITP